MSIRSIKLLLVICGIYDGLLGIVFFLVPSQVFSLADVTPPNHFGYVQFPALMLVIFGIMFIRTAIDPVAKREQILYGMGLKASYFGLVFAYQFKQGIPLMWIPLAWVDLLFFILFFFAWRVISSMKQQSGVH